MTKEQFIALGLTGEQAAKAAEAFKAELVGYIPKARFDEVNKARKQAEETVKERDRQIKDLGDKAKGNEALTGQIRELQAAIKTAADQYAADLKELKMKTALKLFLSPGTHDPDLVAGLLDTSKIELDDSGNVRAGLEDQVKALKKSKAFLFKEKDARLAFKGGVPFPRKRQVCELYQGNFRRRRDGKRPGSGRVSGLCSLCGQQAEAAFRKAFEGGMLWVK